MPLSASRKSPDDLRLGKDPSPADGAVDQSLPRWQSWIALGRVDRYPPRNEGGCVDRGIINGHEPAEDDPGCCRLFEEEKADVIGDA
jgi:hypothetical protein